MGKYKHNHNKNNNEEEIAKQQKKYYLENVDDKYVKRFLHKQLIRRIELLFVGFEGRKH